jgi:hypothetical protein
VRTPFRIRRGAEVVFFARATTAGNRRERNELY